MTDLRIGDVARSAGLRPSAIRYYEKVGLLPRAPRVGRQRRYDPEIIDRLAIVRFAQFVGMTISEIKWLLNDVPGRPPPHRWRTACCGPAHRGRAGTDRAGRSRSETPPGGGREG